MKTNNIYLGNSELRSEKAEVVGKFVLVDGEQYYQIHNYDRMPDFFMTVVSDSNHWMFLSSNGALTAGRINRNNALFPYYTEDKIHDYRNITGSRTYLLINKDRKEQLYEPFTKESRAVYNITANIYKSVFGNNVIFEEINHDLEVTFKYGWFNSEKYGFVKKSWVTNNSKFKQKIKILDGLQNILPYGADYYFQNEYSNLLDAYKKNELVEGTTLGLFMLSSIPVDKAEPSEALRTTTVWSVGFGRNSSILLSENQVNKFITGNDVQTEFDIKAKRGAYLINAEIELDATKTKQWYTIAEVDQGIVEVTMLQEISAGENDVVSFIESDIQRGTTNLKKMVSFADGFQITNTELCYVRHYTNTMFNIMRGGIFTDNYIIKTKDFLKHLWKVNKLIFKEHQTLLDLLPKSISYTELISKIELTKDADLIRIAYEYFPLTFSRRHGDPSRPWNQFAIETKNEDGSVKYSYQGNWRDIFQNWEALCYSYPEFIEGMIYRFVNASTVDGYNPYRIMLGSVDWEAPDPEDPWAYIGYWGDHQIIYLQKLLELSHSFHPGKIESILGKEIFTYTNVPYRIKSYESILKNPKDTVEFDFSLNDNIEGEVEHLGSDAQLLKNKSGDAVYKVNFTEKILVTLLSKLSNFVPEAGIWLNTQRPEWNDANNALVGNGTSMVTLYYIRRFLKFWENIYDNTDVNEVSISEETAILFDNIYEIFKSNSNYLDTGFNDNNRKSFTDKLGQAHWKYRNEIYNFSFSGQKRSVKSNDLKAFMEVVLRYIDQSIKVNKRSDGLYHAYNLINISSNKISIRHLYEMLEGQVAVLSSGALSPEESLQLLDSLKSSSMFRPDQYSYMLYPNRTLARFVDKNIIPKKLFNSSSLLKRLRDNGDTSIIEVDNNGNYHFNGDFRNADILLESLNNLRVGEYSNLVVEEEDKILRIYEEVFDHKSFTGRSGTFYGYEGLGSIYWHMVSKLLLATQEAFILAIKTKKDESLIGNLKDHYYEIKAGIGLYKSPDLYGAFPTDAYSHTPANSGVKQPGLTGQVKEDIISRIGEMGLSIVDGEIIFDASLLNREEILVDEKKFEYYTLEGKSETITLKANQIGYTFCQVPIIYTFSDKKGVVVTNETEETIIIEGNKLNKEISKSIFTRNGEVKLVEVKINN